MRRTRRKSTYFDLSSALSARSCITTWLPPTTANTRFPCFTSSTSRLTIYSSRKRLDTRDTSLRYDGGWVYPGSNHEAGTSRQSLSFGISRALLSPNSAKVRGTPSKPGTLDSHFSVDSTLSSRVSVFLLLL